ncbi:MAG: ATP-binding cassette domain-containing protein, partial [Lachnospiraceae bacterium]|nr:ATP-binding cassette domain-containing protein [Lachnospiraceae bacterium]
MLINSLSKTYWSKGVGKTALSDVTLNVPHGEIFCIMGSSGSGKSTLLKIVVQRIISNRHIA